MSTKSESARALRVMVEELRAEQPPEPDWDALEHRLLEAVAEERPAPKSQRPAFGRIVALAGLAAAVALALGLGAVDRGADSARPGRVIAAADVAPAPGQSEPGAPRDIGALHPGDVIETGSEPVTFAWHGSLSWTLAKESRVVVREVVPKGDAPEALGVGLVRGSLRAEVVPRPAALGVFEPFFVEVDRTRVAVHGTAFSVTRTGDSVIVDVEHGAVAVGPVGHRGETTGHLLVGPARAAFSLDGAVSATFLRHGPEAPAETPTEPALPVEPPADPSPAGQAPPASAVASIPVRPQALEPKSAAAPARELPVDSSSAPPEPPEPAKAPLLTRGAIVAALDRCFVETYGPGVRASGLSISTTFHVTVGPDGRIEAARFAPPLKPEFQACAGRILGGRFEQGPAALSIPVSFR